MAHAYTPGLRATRQATLRRSRRLPLKGDLVVDVSGYSGYFCDLGRSIQEDIIARAEFCKP